MIPTNSTPVPNEVFDYYLRILSPSELKVLLVIIRQTLGWLENIKYKRRKTTDWISHSQLAIKTGYSRKAIGIAITALTSKNLIIVTDYSHTKLQTAHERQGKTRLYYTYNLNVVIPPTYDLSSHNMRTFFTQQKKLLQKKFTLQ